MGTVTASAACDEIAMFEMMRVQARQMGRGGGEVEVEQWNHPMHTDWDRGQEMRGAVWAMHSSAARCTLYAGGTEMVRGEEEEKKERSCMSLEAGVHAMQQTKGERATAWLDNAAACKWLNATEGERMLEREIRNIWGGQHVSEQHWLSGERTEAMWDVWDEVVQEPETRPLQHMRCEAWGAGGNTYWKYGGGIHGYGMEEDEKA